MSIEYYDQAGTKHPQLVRQEAEKQFNSTLLQQFMQYLPESNLPRRVLDVGCGVGLDLQWFSRQSQLIATGIEGSPAMAALARESGLSVVEKDFRLLNLERESYDGIWCNRALVHLPLADCQRVLLSFLTALRPGKGLLYVSYAEGEGSWRESVSENPSDGTQRTFYRFAPQGVLALLKQSGFQPILRAERKEGNETWVGIFARRL